MSNTKIGVLVGYAIFAVLAVTMAGTTVGSVCMWILVGLAGIHTLEIFVHFKKCQAAGGSLPMHLLNVFLFGVVHMKELKQAQTADSVA